MPIFFGSSALGVAAAGSSSLLKLCYLVGALGFAFTSEGSTFEPIEVRAWKGQLPKEVVKKRLQYYLGEEVCKNYKADIWDAVGLGLYKKGVFK